jgi:DNA-binding SARP family transcriptional activator/WD40 repeat protein/energy-coupling factor transporter ATP-binding protein EcfA2
MATPHLTDPNGPTAEVEVSTAHAASVHVLGPVRVLVEGRPVDVGGPKPTLLMALLVARAGAVVSWDALIDGLWGEDPPPTARKAVQVHVSNLRRALGDEFPLRTSSGGYLLDAEAVTIDALEFEQTVDAASRAVEHDPSGVATALRDALALWSGQAYAGLGDCDALAPTIARLTELRLHAQSLLYEARLRLGQHVEIVGDLDALTTDHPYREDLRRLQMLALYRSGRQTEALRVYSRTRALLVDELGIEPSAELRELQGMILDQSPDLDLVATAVDVADDTGRAKGYELRQRLGADEIGVVYSAYQTSTGREVAVKVIRPEFANLPDFVERFEAEAQHVAGLEHPHIVSLYDFWRSPEGAYLVMPYVRGGNLRRSIESTRWDPAAAVRLLDQIGSALSYAHRRGIVHGDLNSTKVLLDEDGNAYLFDFGIARRRRADTGEPGAGRAGDIREFGLLAQELFSGARSAPGEPLASVHWSRNDLPQGLDDVIARSVADDPTVRFPRIDDCLRALRQVFGADVTTGPHGPLVDVDIRNPYKGLRAFAEIDADDYFGRDRLVEQLSERVARNRLTVVVGPSGSGKSSLVKAGLLPLLRRDGLQPGRPTLITEMYPGSYPFEELEAALLRVAVDRPVDLLDELVADDRGLLRASKQILPDDDSDLLLVIDQFEELFSLTADASVRRAFLDNLVTIGRDHRSRVRVVVTVRADFFDHPLEHPAFGDLMAGSLVTVAMPDHDDLARAISEPARAAGLELEAGLVPIITRDVAGEPGALPLMQYALTELVGARVGRELTIDAYERTGGVIGALSRRAEDIFVGLPSSAQRVAEEVFVHLVAVDEDSDDTRRRVRRSELDAMGFSATALDAVIAAFGSFRLLSFDHDPVTRGQTIEVAHEALIREWPRYRTWIEQRREDLILQRRLQVAAVDWESSGREPSFLLGGGRLEQYELWAASTELRIGGLERTFLDRSRQRASQVAESASRRRHRLVGSFAVLAAAAVGVAAVALVQRDRADDAASLAQQAADEAELQRSVAERATGEAEELSRSAERRASIDSARAAGLTAVELADEDPEAAVLVALEAASTADEAGVALPEVVRGLWEGASEQHVRARFDPGRQKWIEFGQGVSPSPDGRLGVATSADETSEREVWLGESQPTEWESVTTVTDLTTGDTISTLAESQGLPLYSTWDPTTGEVLTANGDGSVTWWEPLSGASVRREQLTSGPLWHVTVTDDRLATSENFDRSNGRSVAVLRDRSSLAPLAEVPDSLWSTLSPNGRWWATYAVTREIVFHDARTGAETLRIPHGLAPADAMPFTDWAGQDDAMWLVRSNGALARIELGADAVMTEVSFDPFVGVFPVRIRSSPDGALLAFGDVDSRVRVHDARTGERIVDLIGHQSSPVDAVEWLPDSSGLVTVDRLGSALSWGLVPQSASGLPVVRYPEYPETSAQFGDSVVLLASRDGSGRLVDTTSGETIVEFGLTVQGQDLDTVASEQSGVFVAPSDDGLRVYDVSERRWTAEIVAVGIDQPLALSDDARRLLAGTSPSSRSGASPSAAMFDAATGDELWRIDRFLVDAAVMVDDKVVVAGSRWGYIQKRILVLDAETGEQIAASTRGWTTSAMTVSPDGYRLATVRRSGEIIVYDLDLLIDSPTGQAEVVSNTATVTELVSQLVYSSDGSMLFSGSVDGVLRAWDSETLEQRWSIDNGVSMSGLRVRDDLVWFGQPIDARSGSGEAGFQLAAIPFDQASIAEWASTTVTRNLTDVECQEYLQRACSIRLDVS